MAWCKGVYPPWIRFWYNRFLSINYLFLLDMAETLASHFIDRDHPIFLTFRDISQGLVTAPRSQAVIIMDLRGDQTNRFISSGTIDFYFIFQFLQKQSRCYPTCTCLGEPSRSSCTLRCWPTQRRCFCSYRGKQNIYLCRCTLHKIHKGAVLPKNKPRINCEETGWDTSFIEKPGTV